MEYLQKYLEDLEHVPPHLRQEFKIMRDLDQKVQDLTSDIQQRTTQLMESANELSKEERVRQITYIQSLFKKGKEICSDKVSRAESAYELVDKQIRRLDADMFEFKKALAEKEVKKVKKSRSKGEQQPTQQPPVSPKFCPMSTPKRPVCPNQGVHAPFKSPIRHDMSSNRTDRVINVQVQDVRGEISTEQSTAIDAELERLWKELNENRSEPLNIELELAKWRDRMHAYNEAKDACLEIFGRLAHTKGCLVRELYSQFGLNLDD